MRFSLIVATMGRTVELRRLLESLVLQSREDLEVILVDQNPDQRVAEVIEPFVGQVEIIHTRSAQGATRARNVGLAIASGDIIGFPDDDCWYPPGVLDRVEDFLAAAGDWDGIIGHTIDAAGNTTLPWNDRAGPLSPAMSWRRSVTYVYFLRRDAALAVGGFDLTLGPGAGTAWGAGDDNDFMLRALKTGARVYFEPALTVHHPPLFPAYDDVALEKRKCYARADGRVLRKHPMPLWWRLPFFGMPLARWMLSLATMKRDQLRFHWVTFVGRVEGYRDRLPS